MVLEDARRQLTRREILADWPPDFEAPARVTLWKWLERAVAQGLVCQEGTGRKNDPFRYWLPEKATQWQKKLAFLGPLPSLEALVAERVQDVLRKAGRGRKEKEG